MKPIWGIDLGGTKIEGIVFEPGSKPKILVRKRIPTEAKNGYKHIIGQIKLLIDMLIQETAMIPDAIGIGTPGTLDPKTNSMKNCNATAFNGQALKQDLEKIIELPVSLANDANCFALAETRYGSVADFLPQAEVVFGVILGTGVGGGIVVNGKVINGAQGIAGEWGHNFLHESGGDCYCGRKGCVETILSGTGLQKFYETQSGIHRPLKEIVERHYAGTDAIASQTVDRLIEYFGKAMANVINILDPDAIVLGGGVGNVDLLYTQGVQAVKEHVFNTRLDTLFLRPKLGDSAGVFGAATLVERQ